MRLPIIDENGLAAGWKPVMGLPVGGRDECRDGTRPCVHIRCIHHLWVTAPEDRHGGGNHRTAAIETSPESCERDILESQPDAGPVVLTVLGEKVKVEPVHSAKKIAIAYGKTPQRVNQIISGAIAKLAHNPEAREILVEMLIDSARRR